MLEGVLVVAELTKVSTKGWEVAIVLVVHIWLEWTQWTEWPPFVLLLIESTSQD